MMWIIWNLNFSVDIVTLIQLHAFYGCFCATGAELSSYMKDYILIVFSLL